MLTMLSLFYIFFFLQEETSHHALFSTPAALTWERPSTAGSVTRSNSLWDQQPTVGPASPPPLPARQSELHYFPRAATMPATMNDHHAEPATDAVLVPRASPVTAVSLMAAADGPGTSGVVPSAAETAAAAAGRRLVSFASHIREHSPVLAPSPQASPRRSLLERRRPASLLPVGDGAATVAAPTTSGPPSRAASSSPSRNTRAILHRHSMPAMGFTTPTASGARTAEQIIALASHRSDQDLM